MGKLKGFVLSITFILIFVYLPSYTQAEETEFNHLIVEPAKKPSTAGALKITDINGMKTLSDKNGEPIQLRGMSTHGLQWFPDIVNERAFSALSNDWGANLIRLAMYVGENGYATNPEVIKQRVIDGIELAKANDMYVIVDWHVHAPGDPNAEVYSGAMNFFDEISSLYPNDPSIIYELANEPNSNEPGVTNDAAGWDKVKSYAEPIIEMLRNKGNENLVIVGSPNWSQRPDLAADNPIDDDNTVYTVHFYSGTHEPADDSTNRENVMSNARYAMENGVAVFASEWGTSEANGHNGPYLNEADVWINFLNEHNISWANWSLTNKNETSAAFQPFELGKQAATDLDPGEDGVWSAKELTVSGEYVRARIKGVPYEPIDRTKEEFQTVIWDFNDGTLQGFGINPDSPIKDIQLANSNNALHISGLTNSNDVTEGNYWANLRLSADGLNTEVDILGANELSMDVIVTTPTTVSIAAIPQNSSYGWANPTRAIQVNEEDFAVQNDGTYKAKLSISREDSPNLEAIATDQENSQLTNLILFIGATQTDEIKLDNITVTGDRTIVEEPIVHDELGTPTFPSNFEDNTRQGWKWDQASGVKSSLTIQEANGSKALTWDVAYPEVKPGDAWASAPRIILGDINTSRGENQYLAFDLYLNPVRASSGALSVNLALAPPSLGYWAQAADVHTIDLTQLDSQLQTADGLYHYEILFDLNNILEDKVISADTILRDLTLIIADQESDYAGKMSIDNVRFQNEKTPEPGTGDEEGETPEPGTGDEEGETPEPGTGDEEGETPEPGTGDEEGETPEPGTGDEEGETPEPGAGDEEGETPEPEAGDEEGETLTPGQSEDSGKIPVSPVSDVKGNEDAKQNMIKNENKHHLPQTATTMYNFFLLGCLIILIGSLGFTIQKRRNS
ncbi:carbohydrate-binding domain-containing protein [Metabacillus malikii]|uniref:cellulase n=1 Tax=Metabacillus malikii TaxID=1504265 RepID=A0ABT9ZET6_9BACI|nr:carbohydrate-binding domain-containing protein [Metabacillus malikii]MDQ0230785.1 endoglucanase [Metabacillus malikii]